MQLVAILLVSLVVAGCGTTGLVGSYLGNYSNYYLNIYADGTFQCYPANENWNETAWNETAWNETAGTWKRVDNTLILRWRYGSLNILEIKHNELVDEAGEGFEKQNTWVGYMR